MRAEKDSGSIPLAIIEESTFNGNDSHPETAEAQRPAQDQPGQPLNAPTLANCHRSKRWQELRLMMAMKRTALSASKSPTGCHPAPNTITYENQCIVDMTSNSVVGVAETSTTLSAVTPRRRCSLTMPYPGNPRSNYVQSSNGFNIYSIQDVLIMVL